MSKNLEKEYRAFVSSEVPDLWFRIEAGLDEKTTSDGSVSRFDATTEKTDLHMTDLHKKWHPKKRSFKVWAGLAAACVCAALIIPAMTSTMWRGGRSSGSDSAAPEYAPQMMEARENGAYIDGAAGDAEAACEDSVAEAAEVTADDSGKDNSSTTAENMYISSDTNTSSNNGSDLSVATDSDIHINSNAGADNASGAGMNTDVDNAVEAYQFVATVKILDTDVRMDSGILYTAKVVTSDNPAVQADSEIKIFSSAVSSEGVTALENAKTYELILQEKGTDDSEQDKTYILVEN